MRRLSPLIGAGLVAAAVASVLAVSGGSAQAPAAQTLTFVERSIRSADVLADVPPLVKGKDGLPSKGDSILFRSALTNPAGAKQGSFVGRCTFLKVTRRFTGSQSICDGVYALPGGNLSVSAYLVFNDKPVTFSVDGGTGAYEGARGSGTTTDRPGNDNPLSDTVIRLLA